MARSSALLQAVEVGTCRIAGHLPGLEGAAVTWQAGQHQPDALAALVVAHDVLVHSLGAQIHLVSPLDVARRARGAIPPPPAWMIRPDRQLEHRPVALQPAAMPVSFRHTSAMGESSSKPTYDVIGTRHYFAGAHIRAARLMASQCRERESAVLDARRNETPTVDYDVQSYAVCAIVESAAFLEARVNEIWYAASEPIRAMASQRLAGLRDEQVDAIRGFAERDGSDRLPVIDKLDETLMCATGRGIDRGNRPGQDVCGLVKLRDAFVHFKPKLQWDNEAHDLQTRLTALVPKNPLMQGGKPWFPHHVLCAGVAQWACDKSAELIQQWEQGLGLTNSYSIEYALIITEG